MVMLYFFYISGQEKNVNSPRAVLTRGALALNSVLHSKQMKTCRESLLTPNIEETRRNLRIQSQIPSNFVDGPEKWMGDLWDWINTSFSLQIHHILLAAEWRIIFQLAGWGLGSISTWHLRWVKIKSQPGRCDTRASSLTSHSLCWLRKKFKFSCRVTSMSCKFAV
jgi:hypothetical protein